MFYIRNRIATSVLLAGTLLALSLFIGGQAGAMSKKRIAKTDKIANKLCKIIDQLGVKEVGEIIFHHQKKSYSQMPYGLVDGVIQSKIRTIEEKFSWLEQELERDVIGNSEELSQSLWSDEETSSVARKLYELSISEAMEEEWSQNIREFFSRLYETLTELKDINSLPSTSDKEKERKVKAFANYLATSVRDNVSVYVEVAMANISNPDYPSTESIIRSMYLDKQSDKELDNILSILKERDEIPHVVSKAILDIVAMQHGISISPLNKGKN